LRFFFSTGGVFTVVTRNGFFFLRRPLDYPIIGLNFFLLIALIYDQYLKHDNNNNKLNIYVCIYNHPFKIYLGKQQ